MQKIIDEVFLATQYQEGNPEELANALIKVLEGLPLRTKPELNDAYVKLSDIQSTIELIRKKVGSDG